VRDPGEEQPGGPRRRDHDQAKLNYEQIVRDAIRDIGYVNDDDVFHATRFSSTT
jgi:S-adenosylmethionine synthetase